MKFIEQNVTLLPQATTLFQGLKNAEFCGRVCYNSINKITDESHDSFIKNLIIKKHTSPLMACPIYLGLDIESELLSYIDEQNSPYVKTFRLVNNLIMVETTLRFMAEHMMDIIYIHNPSFEGEDDSDFIDELYSIIEKHWMFLRANSTPFYSAYITTSRAQIDSLYRHTTAYTTGMQSTRCCNYAGSKFDGLTIVKNPNWKEEDMKVLTENFESVEKLYMQKISEGYKAEDIRDILPLSIAAPATLSAWIPVWNDIFLKRIYGITGKPHHMVKDLCEQIKQLINN